MIIISKIGEFENIATDIPTASLQILELGKELINILQGTNEGFEEQGKLLKKFAIRIFKKKAKMPIEEWIQCAEGLLPELKCLIEVMKYGEKNEENQTMIVISEAKFKLMDLKDYYNSTAQMVKKFFKGDDLKDKLEGITNSEKIIDLFIQSIEFFEKKFR